MRAAIYTRYSSENQHERSTADQLLMARRRATQDGHTVVAEYSDEEISAATPAERRDGSGRMIRSAMAGEWEVLYIESLDRGWRDIVDQERVIRRLEHRGIRIVGISDGYDSLHDDRELQRGVRGLFNQNYLRDLAKKTHRGLTGQFERGLFAGGMAYGYRTIERDNGRALVIDDEQAQRVRWIFDEYIAGRSPASIAFELNRLRVASPRGGTWAVSAIYGSPTKGTGILNNELYIGRYIWNKSKWVKDPDTGIRKRMDRPRADWKISNRPELRIVSDETWIAVRARFDRPTIHGGRGHGKPASTILGGLLRCGNCGGSVVAINKLQYGCAARKDRGPSVCRGVAANRATTELRILSTLRDDLLSPQAVTTLQDEVRLLIREMMQGDSDRQRETEKRLSQLNNEIKNLTDAVAAAGWSSALSERLLTAERDRDALRAAVEAPAPRTPDIPNLLARYRELLTDLPGALTRDVAAARTALVELLGEIRLEQSGMAVYAILEIPANRILLSAGGNVSNCGSGGAIPYIYMQRVRVR